MKKRTSSFAVKVNLEAAEVLMSATLDFLVSEGIPPSFIDKCLSRQRRGKPIPKSSAKEFRSSLKAYEEVGIVLSTWFTDARFLDEYGLPLPLAIKTGRYTLSALVRASEIRLSTKRVVELLRDSPSVRFDTNGKISAIIRTFVLPNFQIPRATLIVERLLDTLNRNEVAQKDDSPLLLERSCHVTGVDPRDIAPIMRDIKIRGIAFLDSVDGEIEAHRVRRPPRASRGELGVVAFAWAQNLGGPVKKKARKVS